MAPKKKACYVVMVATAFPHNHPKKGWPTCFPSKIVQGLKKHTFRENYDLWKERFEKIDRDEAYLSLRSWDGRPYHSDQTILMNLYKSQGIGLQKVQMTPLGWFIDDKDSDFTTNDLSRNDGLTPMDFSDWFRGKISIDMEPLALIQFSKFRY